MSRAKLSAYGLATDLTGAHVPILQSGANKRAAIGLFDDRYTGPGIVSAAILDELPELGVPNAITTAFDGDLSTVGLVLSKRVDGADTLGAPATGYKQFPESGSIFSYLRNASGHNEELDGNDGRTGTQNAYLKFDNYGDGDVCGVLFSGLAVGDPAGRLADSTNFLANPAATMFAGNLFGASDGVFINGYEINLWELNSSDIAAIGANINSHREVNDGGGAGQKYTWWCGYRSQSQGSEPIDTHFSASGKAKRGLDLSFGDFSSNDNSAITLSADQRIFFKATASDPSGLSRFPSANGVWWMQYQSSLNAIHFVANNTSALQIYGDQIISPLNIRTDGVFKVSTLQVVGARNTGWTTAAGSGNKDASGINTGTITATDGNMQAVAAWVKSIHDALATHGLIGP